MFATGRSSDIPEVSVPVGARQAADDGKRLTRRQFMLLVAHETDVAVKRRPTAMKGSLPQTKFDYHEKITLKGRA